MINTLWNEPQRMNQAAIVLLVVALVLGLIGAVKWVAARPAFAVTQIKVQGAGGQVQRVDPATMRSTVAGRLNGTFLTMDLNHARHVFESVPWVRKASVRRVWPNKLMVTIEEHEPIATWSDGRLVNTYGELFTANLAAVEDESLAQFSGPTGTEKDVTRRYVQMIDWLEPIQRFPVQVHLSARYALTVKLDNGTQLELGREPIRVSDKIDPAQDMIEQRVHRFVQYWASAASKLPGQLELADMRYSNGFAVRVKGIRVAEEPVTPAVKPRAPARPAMNPTRKPADQRPRAAMREPLQDSTMFFQPLFVKMPA